MIKTLRLKSFSINLLGRIFCIYMMYMFSPAVITRRMKNIRNIIVTQTVLVTKLVS